MPDADHDSSSKENDMRNHTASEHRIPRHLLVTACASALAVTFAIALPRAARADHVVPPPVPPGIEVAAGHKAFLEGHAVGTQNYICLLSGWTLFGPQATLFGDNERQIITHFLSPNPVEGGMPRATWQDSRDTSAVWAVRVAASSDSAFVQAGAIPWFRLQVVGADEGPSGGDKLTATTYIQRLNTSGGTAPPTGCSGPDDVGKTALVPYTADYFFYKRAVGGHGNNED